MKLITLFYFILLPLVQLDTQASERNRAAGDQLQVTPNPGNGLYTLIYKSEIKGTLMLAVSDATGKYVFLKTVKEFTGELKESIDISSNPKGIYIFEVESEKGREARRVIYQ